MRLLRIGLLALIAVPLAVVAGGKAAAPPGACSAPVRGLAATLPAPLTIRTSCGAFMLSRDGDVRLVSTHPSRAPRGLEVWPNGVWDRGEAGHLVVGRRRRTLWRSSGTFRHTWEVGPIALARRELAFSYGTRTPRLYVARLGGPERLVARREIPLGWTKGGVYVGREGDGAILLRRGNRARRLPGAQSRTSAYDGATRALYFVARGRLYRARGSRKDTVAALADVGLQSERSLQVLLLGRLIALQGPHRLVVLHSDGSLLASTSLTGRRRNMLFSGQPTVSARGSAVAFAVLRPDHAIETQRIERGVETVYLLRPGARAAAPVHTRHMWFNVCGHGARLSWHGRWLLYATGEGPGALIDTRTNRAIGLSSLVRRLPGYSGVDESGPLLLTWG